MATDAYGAGDAFAVPLRDGGFAVGVIARATAAGTLFGYFFAPRHENFPSSDVTRKLISTEAVLVGKFGHLGLSRGPTATNGRWQIIGSISGWDERQWPLPAFVRPDPIRGGSFLVTYDDADLLSEREVKYFPPGVELEGPADGLMGAGLVEIRLTRLLAEPTQHGTDAGIGGD